MKTPKDTVDELIYENKDLPQPEREALYVAKKIAQYGPTYPVYNTSLNKVANEIPKWMELVNQKLYVVPKLYWKEVITILEQMQ